MKPTNPNAHTYVEDNDVKVSIMHIRSHKIKVLMLTSIVEQWNNVIAPILFSLRDSITSVATQRRAAIIAFQDMQARRCEYITRETSFIIYT